MIPYILHVTVILTVCFLFYKLFLQKATFYGLNRWTLLSCLVLSFLLPLLPAPRGWSWNTADPVTASPALPAIHATTNVSTEPAPTRSTLAIATRHKAKGQHTTGPHAQVATPKPGRLTPIPVAAARLPAPSPPYLLHRRLPIPSCPFF